MLHSKDLSERERHKNSVTVPKAPIAGLSRRYPSLIILLLLGTLYGSLYNNYRAYEIDNPWYLSFSHNFHVNHITGDFFLNGIFPDGMGGTPVFGRFAALLQAAVLSHAGWMPLPATFFSIALVLAGLFFWSCFLTQQGLSQKQSAAIILALGVTEPFVGMAERFRFEPFSFLLMALAFWLASLRQSHFALSTFSLCLGLLALEIEPAALLIFPSLILYLLRSRQAKPAHVFYGAAFAVLFFAAAYFYLHPDILTILQQTNWHRGSSQRQAGGFLYAYFISRKRHLPEFALALLAAWAYLRNRNEAPPFVRRMAEITGLVCLFSFLMNWPTPAYMIFFFPFFLVVAHWVLGSRPGWILPCVATLLMLPQYAALAVINRHEGWRPEDIRQVTRAIQHSEQLAALDDSNTQIMGDYSLWFAHPKHYRALARTTLDFVPNEQLFLCFDKPLLPPSMVDPIVLYCQDLRTRKEVRELEEIEIRGHHLFLLTPR
jgi:hypothetical protein